MLKPGDIVDIVAPASAVTPQEYESCLKFVESLGLKPKARTYSELVKADEFFCSNSPAYRFEHLEEALKNSESKAVWFLAGGYGSYQLLGRLDKIPAPGVQKLVIGFSDNTVLLDYFINKWNWSPVYGITLAQMVRGQVNDKAIEQFKALVMDGKIESLNLKALNQAAKKNSPVVGKLVGGCLSLMQVLVGTPQAMDFRGRILLLEDDKNETPARVNRILDHMVRAGCFNNVAAVIMGSFLEEDFENKKDEFFKAIEVLKEELDKKNIPLLKHDSIGHCKDMVSVQLGAFININLGEEPVLKFGL